MPVSNLMGRFRRFFIRQAPDAHEPIMKSDQTAKYETDRDEPEIDDQVISEIPETDHPPQNTHHKTSGCEK